MSRLEQLQPLSMSARLRKRWPQIERLLADGVRHVDIVFALQEEDLPLTLKTFRDYLYRQRRRAGRQQTVNTGTALPLPTGQYVASMSVRERRRAHAEQYINPVKSHPLLQRRQRKEEDQS